VVDLIFRHLSGARATQVDIVPLGAHQELILGRAPSAAVRFDLRRDVVVGRHHARLVPVPGKPGEFLLVDLRSRNGTFLNGCLVIGQAAVKPGDVVQLGAGGPEVEIQLDIRTDVTPRDDGVSKRAR
jgi:pSer/pThr/pTyr-binding forkhead associated (FHA) protein